MTTAEFSMIVPLARISAQPQPFHLEAGAAARDALARRFGLLSLDGLTATLEVSRKGAVVLVAGRFAADAVQACIVSGEPVPARLAAPIDLRFQREEIAPGQELELHADELDMLPLDGDSVDLGEAVAQSLGLALDPYPRAPDATLEASRRHLSTEEEAEAAEASAKAAASPFAKLRRP